MVVTEELVNSYIECCKNPKVHDLPFRPIVDCFEKTETVTPCDVLVHEYIKHEVIAIPKFMFYLVMNDVYGIAKDKATDGRVGYFLRFKPNLGQDEPWPLIDVIKKLCEAADILLHKKDYDGHGWEEMELCFKKGLDIVKKLESQK